MRRLVAGEDEARTRSNNVNTNQAVIINNRQAANLFFHELQGIRDWCLRRNYKTLGDILS